MNLNFAGLNFRDCGFSHFLHFYFADEHLNIICEYIDYISVMTIGARWAREARRKAQNWRSFISFCTTYVSLIVWFFSFVLFQLPLHGLSEYPKLVGANRRSEWLRGAKVVSSRIARKMFAVESCICGFHVYGAVWSPRIGEILDCTRETNNREDPFAAAVKKSGETIGHVPRTISCVCSLLRMKQLSPVRLEGPAFWGPGTNELT